MREDSLLVARLGLPNGSFVAGECGEIYVNLANRMKITGMNPVWGLGSGYHFYPAKSGIWYRPPAEFEDICDATSLSSAAKITLAQREGQVSRA